MWLILRPQNCVPGKTNEIRGFVTAVGTQSCLLFFALSQRSTWVLRLALIGSTDLPKKRNWLSRIHYTFFSTVFYSMLKHGHGMYFDMPRFVDGQPGECVEHSRPPKFSKRWLILLSGNLKLGEAIAAYLRSNLKYRYFTLFIWCWSSL